MTLSPYTFKKTEDGWMRRLIPNGKWELLTVKKDDEYRPGGRARSQKQSPENNRYRPKDKWEWV